MMSASNDTSENHAADYSTVPNWHFAWISEHARKLAQETFLASVERTADARTIDESIWEAAGCVVIHDVLDALSRIEDVEVAQSAALYGAEQFLRQLFELFQTSGTGGRA